MRGGGGDISQRERTINGAIYDNNLADFQKKEKRETAG